MSDRDLVAEALEHPLWDKFVEFDEKNPHVFEALVRATHRQRERGAKKTAINRLVQDLRWDSDLSDVESGEPFKLPNAYAPLYSRMIAHVHPELTDMFNFNQLVSATED